MSSAPVTLRTERLLLRQWRPQDREPFAELNADPEVMHHFPSVLDRAASDAVAERIEATIADLGYGFWAVEDRGGFIGFVGLVPARFDAAFTPATEIGWRLARHAWGHGYATEAARATVAYGFGPLGLPELVSFTAAGNTRSRAVMERLGMTHDADGDFGHPNVPANHVLRRHVLYRLAAPPG